MDVNSKSKDILINYKVYIAGQYAPAQEVVVQQGIFTFSEAQITLFPNKELIDFGENDRVPCQIFFLDTLSGNKQVEYKLMFEGEVVGVSYNRSAGAISMTLAAVSPFEILAQMFKSLFSSLENKTVAQNTDVANVNNELGLSSMLGNRLLSRLSDSNVDLNTSFEQFFTRNFLEGRAKSTSNPNFFMRRPYSLLRNVFMDLLNGATVSETKTDVSLFFKSFVTRKSIVQSMFASPILEGVETVNGGPTANIILNAISDEKTLSTIVSGISKLVSLIGENRAVSYWDIVRKVYSIMMYEVIMPLCPPAVSANIFGVPSTENIKYKGIMHLLTKPEINYGIPPVSNIIFPCMINSISYQNNHFTKPTRFHVSNPSIPTKYSGASLGAGNNVVSQIAMNATSATFPKDLSFKTVTTTNAAGEVRVTKERVSEIQKKLYWDNEGTSFNEYFKGPVTLQQTSAPDWINYVKKYLTQKQDDESKDQGEKSETTKQDRSNRFQAVGDILDLYAANEYQKSVGEKNVVSVDLKFNPYILPGFPAAIIDNVPFGVYFLAVPTQIVHRITTSGASTSVQFKNVTRFDKAYKDSLFTEDAAAGYSVGPIHPSPQVANLFNKKSGAENYYQQTLFQGYTKKTYIFDPEKYFFIDPETKKIDTSVDGAFDGLVPGVHNDMVDVMREYEKAMAWVSRPICSMGDFLDSRKSHLYMDESGNTSNLSSISGLPHGGVTATATPMLFNGQPLSRQIANQGILKNIDPDRPILHKIPVYYEKILGYTYLGQTTPNGSILFPGKPPNLANYPDFIKDWASRIQRYRIEIQKNLQDFYIG